MFGNYDFVNNNLKILSVGEVGDWENYQTKEEKRTIWPPVSETWQPAFCFKEKLLFIS